MLRPVDEITMYGKLLSDVKDYVGGVTTTKLFDYYGRIYLIVMHAGHIEECYWIKEAVDVNRANVG